MAELLYRLGRFAARRSWAVITAWIVILAAAGAGFAAGFGGLATSFDIPNTESMKVIDELEDALPEISGATGTIVFATDDGSPLDDAQKDAISALVNSGDALPDVTNVVDPFLTEQQRDEERQQLDENREQLDEGRVQLDAGQQQLDSAREQLDGAQAELDAARDQAEAAGSPPDMIAALDQQQALLDEQWDAFETEQAGVDEARAELDTNAELLDQGSTLMEYADAIRVVSDDKSTALVAVSFSKSRLEVSNETKDAVIEHFESEPIDGVDVAFSTDIAQGVPVIGGIGEVVGVVIAAIVLLIMFGTIIATVMPIVTALLGIGIGAMAAMGLSGVIQMTSVTPVLGIMLGLAVGIDYALFIINRHRKQLRQGIDVDESIGLANGTAGNAVVFAGSTVIVALLALNVTGIPFLGLMGSVGAGCVAIAVLVSISLTPALLGLAGKRVLSKRDERRDDDPVSEAKPMSTGRAILSVLGVIIALGVLSIPALSMRVGLPDGSAEPADSTAYTAYVTTEDAFGAGVNGTLLVAANLPEGLTENDLLAAQVRVADVLMEQDAVAAVAPIAVSDDRSIAAFQVIPSEGPNSPATEDLVHDLRALPPIDGEITLGIAGQAAVNIDISAALDDVLPLYLVVVVGLSLLIMVVVFRSILVPLIATGGFILSLFATYGAVVAIFQWGWFQDLTGVTEPGPILSFLPVILVGILFGLAMDYQLFLATGMREAYVHGAKPRLAVAQGFRAGRSVVVAAGLIMVAVFGGFIFTDSIIIRSIGFGLAFGVLVDAFIVRLVLMPALMHLLSTAAWWLPRFIDRILPNVDVEGASLERRHHSS